MKKKYTQNEDKLYLKLYDYFRHEKLPVNIDQSECDRIYGI